MSKHTNVRGIRAAMSDFTGLPIDVLGTKPLFEMYSDREMIIEGAEELEYYDENCVRIRSGNMIIGIHGDNLFIKCLANKNIAVCGKISEIYLG